MVHHRSHCALTTPTTLDLREFIYLPTDRGGVGLCPCPVLEDDQLQQPDAASYMGKPIISNIWGDYDLQQQGPLSLENLELLSYAQLPMNPIHWPKLAERYGHLGVVGRLLSPGQVYVYALDKGDGCAVSSV